MDIDLSRALQDAADRTTAHRPALAAAPVLRRVRRRRTVVRATEVTAGVAAAGVVAVGAVELTEARRTTPAPPAVTRPAPTPSPTPSAEGPWPAVTPLGALECGLPVPMIDDPDGPAELHLDLALSVVPADPADPPAAARPEVPTLVPGDRLAVDGLLVNGVARPLDAVTRPDGRAFWVAQDGTVVGRLAVDPADAADATHGFGSEADGVWPLDQVVGAPVLCGSGAGDDGAAEALPPGEYQLYAVHRLELVDDGPTSASGDAVIELAEGPLPFSVTGSPAAEPGTGVGTDEPDAPAPDAVAAHPSLEDLEVTPAGLGPLAVGVPPATNPGAAMIAWDPEACDTELLGGTEPGRWVASGYPEVVVDGQPRPPFRVDADDEAVRWIDVVAPVIRTPEGVGMTTPLDELRSTYPGLEGPHEGPVSRVWWLTGPTGTLVFETQDDSAGLQPAGTPEVVILMRVLAAGVDPAFATANSDHVAGGCL